MKTALVELEDFSSGTSSRSTKLLHGGVRYLQKAIFNLDIEQYRMVKEALHERANLLEIAPHLSYPLPIVSEILSCCVKYSVNYPNHLTFQLSLFRCCQFTNGGKFHIIGLALKV